MTDGIPTMENAPSLSTPKPAEAKPLAKIESPKPPDRPRVFEPQPEVRDSIIDRIKADGDPEIAMKDIRNELQPKPNELETVKSEEEIAQRLKEQIPQYTKEATDEELDARRQTLREKPQLSGFTLKDTLVGLPQETQFAWVQVDKIVGRSMKTQDGWSDEIAARQGRVVQVARNLINSNAQNIEEIFHPARPMERIKITQIPGPSGPMYYVDDGTHRVSGAMTAGLKEIPAEVKKISYPLEDIAPIDPDKQSYQIYEWEKLIELGLVDGKVVDHVFSDGTKGKKLIVQKEVLPWIRSSQGDLIEISHVYEQLYPGSLDNLPIPKEALLDPIANNFYRAGRFEEWRTINANEQSAKHEGEKISSVKAPESTLQSAEHNLFEPEKRFLETSRNVGKLYTSIINEYTGNGNFDQETLNSLPPQIRTRMEAIARSAKAHQTEQEKSVQEKNLKGADLLAQYGEKFAGILGDPSKYTMTRLGTGMYRVDMDSESFRKILHGANAVAAKPKDGIPFIITQRPQNGEREEQDPYFQENIPHEAHHILWGNAQKNGAIDTSETDPFAKRAFLDFQDEVIARAVSNGKLHGNTILSSASDEQKKALEAKYPDAVQKVKDISPKLNDTLEVLDNRLKDNSVVKKSDLLLAFMSAGNFAELQTNIKIMKSIVDKTASKSGSDSAGENKQDSTQLDII